MKKFTNIAVVLWGFLAGFMVLCAVVSPEGLILFAPVGALAIWRFLVNLKRYRSPEYRAMQEQARGEWAEYKAGAPERKKQRQLEQERRERDKTPVSAVLISTKNVTGKSAVGTAARGALGYAVFGVFGAAVGITSARSKVKAQTATFSVKYASGRTGTETVNTNSARFRELAKLLVK